MIGSGSVFIGSNFNQTLRSFPEEDDRRTLINNLLNIENDIHKNIFNLLTDYSFNETLRSFPDEALDLIKSLVNKKEDIQENILKLLKDRNFIKTLCSHPDKGLELIKFLIERQEDISDETYNKLSKINVYDSAEEKITKIYNILGIKKVEMNDNKQFNDVNSNLELESANVQNNLKPSLL